MTNVTDISLELQANKLGLAMSYKTPQGIAKLLRIEVDDAGLVTPVYMLPGTVKKVDMEFSFYFED